MNRFVKSILLAAALLFASVPAFAAPIPYPNSANINTPLDAANYVISVLNGSSPAFSSLQTGTAASGAITLNGTKAFITSEALTTAAGSDYTLTWTNSAATAVSIVHCSVGNGTNTTVGVAPDGITPAAGSVVIKVRNTHASAALNGTIVLGCTVSN